MRLFYYIWTNQMFKMRKRHVWLMNAILSTFCKNASSNFFVCNDYLPCGTSRSVYYSFLLISCRHYVTICCLHIVSLQFCMSIGYSSLDSMPSCFRWSLGTFIKKLRWPFRTHATLLNVTSCRWWVIQYDRFYINKVTFFAI